MLGSSRLTDLTIGIGSHGKDCCPHVIIGYRITGSSDTFTNSLNTSTAPASIGIHNCPHCSINMCITGSTDVFINNLPDHRLLDTVTEFCGVGNTITASNDHIDD